MFYYALYFVLSPIFYVRVAAADHVVTALWGRNGGLKCVAGKNGRNPEKKTTQNPFRAPRNSHVVTDKESICVRTNIYV